MAEDYVYRNIAVERGPLDTSGRIPRAVIRFKLDGGKVAHITMYWTGNELHAQFTGSRENAEQLASIIRALGGKVEIKYVKSTKWRVQLTTDGITAIRHDGWLNAVRRFVDELYGRGMISKERYEKLVRDIETGPNTVKLAGAKFSVNYKNDNIHVKYKPRSEASKNAAVNALSAWGLKEGKHFTVREYSNYEINVAEAYTKAVKALTQSELKEGEQYVVDSEKRIISVKAEHKDAVVNALKAAGLEEGKDFTIKGDRRYVINITYDGLREIQRMALNGDVEAEQFIRVLEDVLRRRYGDNAVKRLIEVLAQAREEGTLELPLPVRDDKGNIVARVVDLRYEFVENGQPVSHCAGENCRLRIIAEYEAGGKKRQLKMEWYWKKIQKRKGEATATYYFETAWPTVRDSIEATVLNALTGKGMGRSKICLLADQLDALRRFKQLKDAIDKWREGKPISTKN